MAARSSAAFAWKRSLARRNLIRVSINLEMLFNLSCCDIRKSAGEKWKWPGQSYDAGEANSGQNNPGTW